MSDTVSSLRERAGFRDDGDQKGLRWAQPVLGEQLHQAADEIERLRTALQSVKTLVTGDSNPRWDKSWQTTTTRNMIADVCDIALRSK